MPAAASLELRGPPCPAGTVASSRELGRPPISVSSAAPAAAGSSAPSLQLPQLPLLRPLGHELRPERRRERRRPGRSADPRRPFRLVCAGPPTPATPSTFALGLLCFRSEDADALLSHVRTRQLVLGKGAKVVPITLDQIPQMTCPHGFCKGASAVAVNLSSNQLSGSLDALSSCIALWSFDAGYNKFNGPNSPGLGDLHLLQSLALRGNSLTGV